MLIKQLGAILKLGFVQRQIELGSACCLEEEHEKECCNFQTWTHIVKGYICYGAVPVCFGLSLVKIWKLAL